jgi:endoglucanase
MGRQSIPATLLFLVLSLAACMPTRAVSAWPDWDLFAARFLQRDGRVVDLTFEGKTTSEGQSYGLFFALVANRRDQFDVMLRWTSENLAGNALGERLPAWLWGQRADGRWGVKDENSASDADLWIAYSLLEAGRLWHEPAYAATGRKLLALIANREIVKSGAAGLLLLPAPIGFTLEGGHQRINPSYLPGFLFHALAAEDPAGPWQDIWSAYLRLAPQLFAAGVAPDLVIVDASGHVSQDSEKPPLGSYDAIRVYLWAGMSGGDSEVLVQRLAPFAALIRRHGEPPEKVDPVRGVATKLDYSPTGYSGAVLPFLSSASETASLERQVARVSSALQRARAGESTNYYDRALILFGKGWFEHVYRFTGQGQLVPAWQK